MEFNIALLKGDGIGPEIVDSAVAVLEKTADKFGHKFKGRALWHLRIIKMKRSAGT